MAVKCPRESRFCICQTCEDSVLNCGEARCFDCIDCMSPLEAEHCIAVCTGYRPAHICETCLYHLGGGCCRINLESECGKGEHEAWRPRDTKEED